MTKLLTKTELDVLDPLLPNGQFSTFDQECMYPALIKSTKDDVYLEIGVDRGKSLAFARKYFKGDVFGIDLADEGGSDVKGANFIHSDVNDVIWTLSIKVLFIDGEHRYEQIKREWEKFSGHVVKGGWIFFHDADSTSPEVEKFCKEIGCRFSKEPRCSMAWIKK